MDLFDIILHRQPSILEAFCALAYSLDKTILYCPEYQIFNFINQKSLIINFNHDSLAYNNIINNQMIHHPHGRVTENLKIYLTENLNKIIEYGISLSKYFLFLSPENELSLINNPVYVTIQEKLKNQYKFLVIIGYSFFKKDTSDIYDKFIFDVIRSYILEKRCKVLILDLEPMFVADILSKSMTVNIFKEKINWPAFTHAADIVCKSNFSNLFKMNKCEFNSFRLLYEYYYSSSQIGLNSIPYYLSSSKTIISYFSTEL